MAIRTTRPPQGPMQTPVGQTSSGAKAGQLMRSTLAKPTLQSPTQGQANPTTRGTAPAGNRAPANRPASSAKATYPAGGSPTKSTPTQPTGGAAIQRTAPAAAPQQTQTFKKGGKVKPPVKPKKRR